MKSNGQCAPLSFRATLKTKSPNHPQIDQLFLLCNWLNHGVGTVEVFEYYLKYHLLFLCTIHYTKTHT